MVRLSLHLRFLADFIVFLKVFCGCSDNSLDEPTLKSPLFMHFSTAGARKTRIKYGENACMNRAVV
jgi:hypothetical protein